MARKGVEEIEGEMDAIKTQTRTSKEKPAAKTPPKSKTKPAPQKRTTPRKTSKKSDLWLEKLEAKYISLGLQFLTMAKYGVSPELPTEQEQEHLAHILERANDKPPLSWVQKFLRGLLPMAEPDAVPGRSLFGDFTHYTYAWHKHNPELYLTMMAYHDIYIPFINGFPAEDVGPVTVQTIPKRNVVEGKIGERLTDEQWNEFLLQNYGLTNEEYERQIAEGG
jgi:hypothetical protein